MRAFLILAVALFLFGAAKADPVNVTKSDAATPGLLWALKITGSADRVTIENVVVNRGCKAQQPPQLPQTLGFGETHLYGYYLCDPIEVQVFTEQGSSTVTWPAFVRDDISISITRYDATTLVVTNHADGLIINDIIVNRGNCKMQDLPPSHPLKFGQRYKIMLFCEPLEVQVKTNRGSPTFSLR